MFDLRRIALFALVQALANFVIVGLWWFLWRGGVPAVHYLSLNFPLSVVVFTGMAAAVVGYWPLVWIVYALLVRASTALRLAVLVAQPFVHLLVFIALAGGDKSPAFSLDYPGWAFATCGAIASVLAAIALQRMRAATVDAGPRR